VTATASVGLLLICVFIYVIACDLLRARRRRDLRRRLVCERNRNRFGELRTKLVRLAIGGELNPRSEIFTGAYKAMTTLMRNPDALEAAAQAVLTTLPPPEQQPQRHRPTRLEGEIVREFAVRIDLLCRDYSTVYLVASWILERVPRSDGTPLWLAMVTANAARHAQRAKFGQMVDARQRLEVTAQRAA
jgi:hypothetical protein